jgi:hypothetical protein
MGKNVNELAWSYKIIFQTEALSVGYRGRLETVSILSADTRYAPSTDHDHLRLFPKGQ